MELWELIQASPVRNIAGLYDKEKFCEMVKSMTLEEFSRSCRQLLHLQDYYQNTVGLFVTSKEVFPERYPDDFFVLGEINADDPVPFNMVRKKEG